MWLLFELCYRVPGFEPLSHQPFPRFLTLAGPPNTSDQAFSGRQGFPCFLRYFWRIPYPRFIRYSQEPHAGCSCLILAPSLLWSALPHGEALNSKVAKIAPHRFLWQSPPLPPSDLVVRSLSAKRHRDTRLSSFSWSPPFTKFLLFRFFFF